jgi:hypothetical protein
LIFRWYLTPPLPIYILAIFLGLERIAKDFPLKYLGLGGILLATFLTVRGWTIRPDHGSIRPAPKMAFIKLELLYEKVGRELRDRVRSDETLASGDIGAIGYYSNAKILDTVGLISPGVEEYYPLDPSAYAINYAMSSALIMDFQPEYLVLLEAYGRNTLLQDPDFLEKYSLVDVFETDIYGSDGMLLYELK